MNSSPSIVGILRSVITRLNFPFEIFSSASMPSHAVTTVNPCMLRDTDTNFLTVAESSTMSTSLRMALSLLLVCDCFREIDELERRRNAVQRFGITDKKRPAGIEIVVQVRHNLDL